MVEIRHVFVSSTFRDLEDYREQVRIGLLRRDAIAQWRTTRHIDAVAASRQRFEASDAFFGLVAHWYGFIPDGAPISITEQEYGWALERWPEDDQRPMAVFLPKIDSAADRALRQAADKLIDALPDAERQRHREAQERFRQSVQRRTDRYFVNPGDLQVQAIVAYSDLVDDLLRAGIDELLAAGAANARQLEPEDLGTLGRREHLAAIEDALAEVLARPEVPALALLLCDSPSAGQRELLARIGADEALGARARPILPPGTIDRATVLARIAAAAGGDPRDATVESAAAAVHTRLADAPLALVLDQANRFPGGTPAFHALVWQPFHEALRALRADAPAAHRLTLLAVDYTGDRAALDAVCQDAGDAADAIAYDRLLLLPALGAIVAKDLRRWLKELAVPDVEGDGWAALIARVLHDDAGASDGTPSGVFGRLYRENLWPVGESDP